MKHPLDIPIKNIRLRRFINWLTKLDVLKTIYDDWLLSGNNKIANQGEALLDFGLQHLGVTVDWVHQENLNNLPTHGPLVIVANHPLGGLEGMLLAREILKIRPDLKVLTNQLLLNFPEFKEIFIGVDVLNRDQTQSNSKGIRTASKHLRNQAALLIFPAGTVAGIQLKNFSVKDSDWNNMVGSLILKYQAASIPFFVNETNSKFFYLSKLIHKRIRTALLGREMIAKNNSQVQIIVGEVIEPKELKGLTSSTAVTEYLRLCCDIMATQHKPYSHPDTLKQCIKKDLSELEIINQLQKLQNYRLIQKANLSVYCAPYSELGCVMEQIAISRERTFRGVDEGTGKELDSDKFDPFYWHLWVWDDDANKLVGGYRLGKVDEITKRYGIQNLYSNSLYHYQHKFISGLENSIEVGRSFVSLEYQRNSRVLDLLWRGIGAFMVANAEYHTLFGCVSVSKEYSKMAQAFLADSLLKHFNVQQEIMDSIKPKRPLRVLNKPWSEASLFALSNIPIINKLLGRIDNGKSIPMLIRHYLALNGRFASFSLNENFNHSLDGLIIVDLRLTPDKYLNRYLGKEGAIQFLHKWGIYERVA